MIRYLAFEVVRKLICFAVKGRLSPYYIPQTIGDEQTLDYNKRCRIPFGAFTQSSNENNPTSSNNLHTINGIHLRSLDTIQGGHEIFDIHSHRFITRRKIIEIPIPKAMIKHIEEMVADEKSTLLKLKIRAGVIYDNNWISGVEYKNTEEENKDYREEDQEDE